MGEEGRRERGGRPWGAGGGVPLPVVGWRRRLLTSAGALRAGTEEFLEGFSAAIAANKVWKERLLNAPDTCLTPEVDRDLTAFIESHQ